MADTIFFRIEENGDIGYTFNNGWPGGMPTIEAMREVRNFADRYIRKYKNNETIKIHNLAEIKQEEIEDEKRRAENREIRRQQKENPKPKEPKSCYIYVIRDQHRGFYKIGKAANVHSRFKSLLTANPSIELAGYFAGIEENEKELHRHFSDKNVGGEWFSFGSDDIDFINSFFHHANLPF